VNKSTVQNKYLYEITWNESIVATSTYYWCISMGRLGKTRKLPRTGGNHNEIWTGYLIWR